MQRRGRLGGEQAARWVGVPWQVGYLTTARLGTGAAVGSWGLVLGRGASRGISAVWCLHQSRSGVYLRWRGPRFVVAAYYSCAWDWAVYYADCSADARA